MGGRELFAADGQGLVDLAEGGGEVAEAVQDYGEVPATEGDGRMIGAELAQVGGEGEFGLFAGGLIFLEFA